MNAIFQFIRSPDVGKSIPTAMAMKHTFEGHQGTIRSFVFLQDNVYIVSGSLDGTMRKWDCETGQLVGEPWKGEEKVSALALSPDGKTIACGRNDGSVERWDTNGQMKGDIWTGHRGWVRSLSWSPSGGHLASGYDDGTILVRNVESGAVEVGPIKTNQGRVWSVAYSPLGDKIASGGHKTICIWDSHTGELLVGPITGLVKDVTCVVWSSDGSKLYSTSDQFARILDSTSGTRLHRLKHNHFLNSIALSPKDNLLTCVGRDGIAQLWDTESHEPLHVPGRFLNQTTSAPFHHVAFSPDGRYFAYGGADSKITLWTVGDDSSVAPASSTNLQDGMQQGILPKSQSSSLNVSDINLLAESAVNDEQGHNSPYNAFFAPPQSPLPMSSPNPSPSRRFRHVLSVFHLPTNKSMLHKHFTRRVFQRHSSSTSPSHPPADCEQPQPTLKGKSRAVNIDEEHGNVNSSEDVTPETIGCGNGKGKQRDDPIAHRKTSTLSSPAELDNNDNWVLWKSLFRSRKHDSNNSPAKVTRDSSTEVVDVYAVRIHQGYVAHKRKDKKQSAPKGGSSQADPMKHGNPAHPPTSSQGPSSQPIAGHPGQPLQVNDASYTDNDSHSNRSTHGPFFRFIDKMCFPCGHYEHEDT